jgi:hypothetical protein
MPKYEIVKASSYDPSSLADQLTQKSAEGWEVVAIVPTGGDVTAFIRREGDEPAAAEAPAMESEAPPMANAYTPEPVAEPAGWGVAPESSSAPDPAPMAPIGEPSTSQAPPTVSMYQPSQPAASAPSQPATAAVPSVPAGWYADPSGRFEQRYWDGGTWTEHVARGGAQYTDPPVA